ncbi:preprotein translocase subunit SecE [Gilvimarinus agarilyticus]|uniref:preprotein translocase subunit SecE n=1 Tax=unclassified Gilvimarinus TaxID=2642066 RepID=UPI001C083EAD|nr:MULTISPECIES: preprotein translocase subunit SecE [unclassified Gilvimarinus]MBU2887677.1 preprotein translocase subunit SecE [Gilvimarinus agarilyticus]MDO6572326.1 preprotein translocase subunit SecE [Gilvimarinus sp. 2_MG-2023]MDO6748614.1 preprotein translocase subunit SecE [Gilvimarinus sp. 1_MG-2023]
MSTTKNEPKEYRLDALKWLMVIAVVAVGVVGNSMFSAQPLLYRVLALLALGLVGLAIASQTAKGSGLIQLLRESVVEVRKVVWPTRQETNQTTLLVVVVVIVMALILWGLDTIFGFVASKIIG